ncbi:Protein of unknown function [Propionibacterium freudenreichii subsp. freudenreichii]|uniref:Uncharacterized protein n=2 Tax=Propionibacterium freudenreichii TaxID=1744 RepID=D7GDF2_PROFC|nr:Hypothetical protein PFREUD_10400 [Propionibacterium freudenreichii subsp. shermanii CIRM-BIA1]CEG88914.1 Protein of unknown function [Propionibacterium freudenreichii]CEP26890.1 Protein of unknown function [Propionibacterium freudenreichii subsp. freudenreichii]CEG97819.1 Protein of unknown function [Propionibacterium freudenreichii]CEH05496.1 Protein of unknown function [Propionibacterium freudenreichii]
MVAPNCSEGPHR